MNNKLKQTKVILCIIHTLISFFICIDYRIWSINNLFSICFILSFGLIIMLILCPLAFVTSVDSRKLIRLIKNVFVGIISFFILLSIINNKPVTSYDGAIGYIAKLFNSSILFYFYGIVWLVLLLAGTYSHNQKKKEPNRERLSDGYLSLVGMMWTVTVIIAEIVVAVIACLSVSVMNHYPSITLVFVFFIIAVTVYIYNLKEKLDIYNIAYQLKQLSSNNEIDFK